MARKTLTRSQHLNSRVQFHKMSILIFAILDSGYCQFVTQIRVYKYKLSSDNKNCQVKRQCNKKSDDCLPARYIPLQCYICGWQHPEQCTIRLEPAVKSECRTAKLKIAGKS